MENDLIWFISDSFQSELKQKAQEESGGRFENALSKYSELFFDELRRLKSSHDIDILDNKFKNKADLYECSNLAYDDIKRNINTYKKLFDALLYTYKLFLKGKHFQATLHLFDILEEYKIADSIDPKELGLFYKGRKVEDREDTSLQDFYYHIPYNKRHLISNQRFSVSGQPILYLGSSILDVLYELRLDVDSYQDVAIASFRFNSISDETNESNHELIKVYDISNQIMKFFFERLALLNYNDIEITELYSMHSSEIDKLFKKFILMQLCTFKSNNSGAFVEEYVLGQLLTEALRINNYDGVKFPSTQFDDKNIKLPMFKFSAVKENLALFTSYSEDDKYDYKLIKRFLIQPLNVSSMETSIEQYKKQISELFYGLFIRSMICCNEDFSNPFENASSSLEKVFMCEKDCKVDDKDYYCLPFADLELQAQVDYLKYIDERLCNLESN